MKKIILEPLMFGMFAIDNYYECYLKTDVLLLADVFEKLIKTCLDYYLLDSCHYFSSSELTWGVMLKMTGIKVDLISDADMHLFIEKGMRVVFHIFLKDIVKQIINT